MLASVLASLLFLHWISDAATPQPMYKYLKELCPPGMLPLTGAKKVKTCASLCPLDAQCIQGICCVKQPTCLDLTYKFSTFYACLPHIKQSCPSQTKCVPSNRLGMSICCSLKKLSNNREPKKNSDGVCPASHPVISHENNQLKLCKSCRDGICVAFRKSEVSVCCQSFAAICGPDSVVEMDGLLARDCSKNPCSQGFECSLTSSGSRICCSLAICSSGYKARSVCAGGCRRNEQCEEINGQRWCCPKMESCPERRKSVGRSCSLTNPRCPLGSECMQSEEGKNWLCCELLETTKPMTTSLMLLTTAPTTRRRAISTTSSPFEQPICDSSDDPLLFEGEFLTCPEEGAPCPKAGYTCQMTTNHLLYCCPLPESMEIEEFTTRRTPATKPSRGKQSLAKIFKEITATPVIKIPTDQGSDPPKCLPGHVAARNPVNNEIKRCGGFLDFSCPFGFVCQPSTTTAGFLCCAKIG